MAGAIGTPNFASFRIGPESTPDTDIDTPDGGATRIDFSDGTSEYVTAVRYSSEAQAAENRSTFEADVSGNIPPLQDPETEVDGRVITVTGSVKTSEL